jgi:hypothetical protein
MNVMATMLGIAVLLTATSAGADRGIVSMRVWPATSIEPATVLVQVHVRQDQENRMLRLAVDSDDFSVRSERQLDGESAPRMSTFECRQLPAGQYEVDVEVIGANGRSRAGARSTLSVLPR